MRNNWKKKLSWAILASAPIILSACGGGDAAEEAPRNADGDIIMTIGQQTQPNSKLPEGDTYSNNAYRRLVKAELGVELESAFEATGDEYTRQISLAMASGVIPDIMVVSRDELEELVDNDLIADLSDIYDEYASDNIKDIYNSFDGVQLDAATIDGRLMALPGTANDFGPNLVWIRQDWVDKLNIELDTDGNKALTLDELKATVKAFKEEDPGNAGKSIGTAVAYWLSSENHGGSGFSANPILNAFGAYPKNYLTDDEGQVYYGSNTPEMKHALEYLKGWFDEGLLDPQFGTRTYDDINAMMVNGELGIIPGPWHFPDWALVQAKTSNPEVQFVPYAIENANGDGKVNGISKPGTGSFVVVRKGFEKPEVAVEMINLIFDEIPNSEDMENEFPEIYEYAQKAVDGSVRPVNIELFKNLSEIADAVEATKGANGEINIVDITSFTVRNNANKVKKYLDNPADADPTDWAVYASRLLAVDGVMNTLRENNTLNEITPPVIFEKIQSSERNGAQIAKLEEETMIKFITGAESLDKFDEYVDTWNKQGGSEIIQERQEILDGRE
jgi:putative aldouronate transport system substrate-binding protein